MKHNYETMRFIPIHYNKQNPKLMWEGKETSNRVYRVITLFTLCGFEFAALITFVLQTCVFSPVFVSVHVCLEAILPI